MEENLKYLILGYRKHTDITQRELANKLDVPLDIVVALEMGSFRYPTERLMTKIEKLTSEFDRNNLIYIGRGYRIRDGMGPYFKYFLRGLQKMKGMDPTELEELPSEECYRAIGSIDLDEFEVLHAGRTLES
ncbi:hypothetical protein [Methanobacterium sp. MBAC-LM]|uniref:hypothetical protein n=1 Tax=Methanobacterium sp. MBAC-LM TaxID=3412034 RepID=UPI003C76AD4C